MLQKLFVLRRYDQGSPLSGMDCTGGQRPYLSFMWLLRCPWNPTYGRSTVYTSMCTCKYSYTYIYIYMYREKEMSICICLHTLYIQRERCMVAVYMSGRCGLPSKQGRAGTVAPVVQAHPLHPQLQLRVHASLLLFCSIWPLVVVTAFRAFSRARRCTVRMLHAAIATISAQILRRPSSQKSDILDQSRNCSLAVGIGTSKKSIFEPCGHAETPKLPQDRAHPNKP